MQNLSRLVTRRGYYDEYNWHYRADLLFVVTLEIRTIMNSSAFFSGFDGPGKQSALIKSGWIDLSTLEVASSQFHLSIYISININVASLYKLNHKFGNVNVSDISFNEVSLVESIHEEFVIKDILPSKTNKNGPIVFLIKTPPYTFSKVMLNLIVYDGFEKKDCFYGGIAFKNILHGKWYYICTNIKEADENMPYLVSHKEIIFIVPYAYEKYSSVQLHFTITTTKCKGVAIDICSAQFDKRSKVFQSRSFSDVLLELDNVTCLILNIVSSSGPVDTLVKARSNLMNRFFMFEFIRARFKKTYVPMCNLLAEIRPKINRVLDASVTSLVAHGSNCDSGISFDVKLNSILREYIDMSVDPEYLNSRQQSFGGTTAFHKKFWGTKSLVVYTRKCLGSTFMVTLSFNTTEYTQVESSACISLNPNGSIYTNVLGPKRVYVVNLVENQNFDVALPLQRFVGFSNMVAEARCIDVDDSFGLQRKRIKPCETGVSADPTYKVILKRNKTLVVSLMSIPLSMCDLENYDVLVKSIPLQIDRSKASSKIYQYLLPTNTTQRTIKCFDSLQAIFDPKTCIFEAMFIPTVIEKRTVTDEPLTFLTWNKVKALCESYDMRLPTLDDENDIEELANFIRDRTARGEWLSKLVYDKIYTSWIHSITKEMLQQYFSFNSPILSVYIGRRFDKVRVAFQTTNHYWLEILLQ